MGSSYARRFRVSQRRFSLTRPTSRRMIRVIASSVRIVEGRHAFQESTNLSRLTYLALVFGSLFSMGKDMALGSLKFGCHFVVAIPLLLLTFVLALSLRPLRH
ncbi:hypothetical protein DL98DRAFT_190441 [Cadophora sp. DSE1049]|nr:hypothetical protein DL98DRAFT_190441 [Cadophora sp. DSE1049]